MLEKLHSSWQSHCPIMAIKWGKRSVSETESVLSTNGFAYTFIALYVVSNILLFLNAAVSEAARHEDFQKYTTAIARGCGATINFNMAFVILLASRSALSFLRETPMNMVLPLDKAMPDLHRVVGILIVNAGVVHAATHWVTYIIKKPWSRGYDGFTSLFVSGMILLILIVAIRVVARTVVYQSNYEVFYRIHVGGGVAMFITLVIHGLHHGVPNSWKWVVGPAIIYALDVGARSFREKRSYLLVSKHSAVFQGPDILKIRLPRVFHFVSGQYAELKVPEISNFQWHPFTIASAPHEPEMVFYIKAVGDWTVSLYQLFGERIRANGRDIEVHIRGPFGAATQHVGQFDRVILIGGGVGATPFCSVTKDAHNWITNWTPASKRKQVRGSKKGNITQRRTDREYEDRRPMEVSIRRNRLQGSHRHQARATPSASTQDDRDPSSHLFTTNVYSEQIDSSDIERLGEIGQDDEDPFPMEASRATETLRDSTHTPIGKAHTVDRTTEAEYSLTLYTARDYLSEGSSSSSGSTEVSLRNNEGKAPTPLQNALQFEDRITPRPQSKDATASKSSPARKFSQAFSRSSRPYYDYDDDGMGSYRDNSSGRQRRSLDYYTALYSAYSEQESNEVYQRSLDMIVSLSFGSVSLVRNMQMRKAQRTMRQTGAEQLPMTIDKEDLSIFHNPRVMFLLFMRSVTVNMVLLWILIVRFIIAGTAFVFDGLRVFDQGIAIYKSPILTGVDLLLVFVVALLVGIPSVLEIIELGAAPVHGVDLFVLTPIALFGVVADIVALLKIGEDVELFGVVHLFVLWPILAILVMIRLLRVIGERIAQAESLLQTHSSTKAVDFYWTAPTPEDDRWLVNELAPYSNIESVQLHRYLTRCTGAPADGVVEPADARYLQTNYGRPNWDEVLNEIAECCKNNMTIGVFFCGPHSMGEAVQDACMGAMRNSIVRGLQSGAQAMRRLEEIFGAAVSANEYTGETADAKEAGARGCNVKFVFKRETFA